MGILGDIVGGLSGSSSAKKLGHKQRAFVRQGSKILKEGAKYNAERMRYGIPRAAEIQRQTQGNVYDVGADSLLRNYNALMNASQGSANALSGGENAALAETLKGLEKSYLSGRGGIEGATGALQQGINTSLSQGLKGLEQSYLNRRSGIEGATGALGRGIGTARNEALAGLGNQMDALKGMMGDSQGYANRGLDMFKGFADEARGFYKPFLSGGQDAQRALSENLGLVPGVSPNTGFFKSPGYQFELDEGNKNIQQSAAARGGLFGGATGKALQSYGQGVASKNYNSYMDRLSDLATRGQTAAGSLGGFLQNSATGQSGILSDLSNQQERMGNTGLGIIGNRSQAMQDYTKAAAQNQANLASGLSNLTADYYGNRANAQQGATQALAQNQANKAAGLSALSSDYYGDISRNKALNDQKLAAIQSDLYGKQGQTASNYMTGLGNLKTQNAQTLGGIDLQKLQQTLANQMNKKQQYTNINYDTNARLGDISSNVYKSASGADRGFVGGLLGTVGGIAGGALGGLPGAALGASLGGGMVGNPYGQQGGGGGFGGLALQGLGMLGSGIGGLFSSPASYGIGSQLYPQGMGMGIGQQALPLSSFQAGYGA